MVITRRSAGGIAAIWLAAVVGVSATAWVAIDRAGRDITNDIVTAMPLTPVITPTTTPQPSATSPKPSAAPKPVASRKPSVKPKPPPVAIVNTGPPATPAPTGPASKAPPAPTEQVRTIVLQGGVVSVVCTGTAIALRLAQPEFDWNVLADDTSKVGTIYVTFFRTGEEDSQRRTLVSVACANGVPAFKTNAVGSRND